MAGVALNSPFIILIYGCRVATAVLSLILVGILIGRAARPVPPLLAFPFFAPFFALVAAVLEVGYWDTQGLLVPRFLSMIFCLAAFASLASKFRTTTCVSKVNRLLALISRFELAKS